MANEAVLLKWQIGLNSGDIATAAVAPAAVTYNMGGDSIRLHINTSGDRIHPADIHQMIRLLQMQINGVAQELLT